MNICKSQTFFKIVNTLTKENLFRVIQYFPHGPIEYSARHTCHILPQTRISSSIIYILASERSEPWVYSDPTKNW